MELLLSSLKPGQSARVTCVDPAWTGAIRLRELGLVEGTEIKCQRRSPLGDPALYALRGMRIALRRADCARIRCARLPDEREEAAL